MNHDAFMIGLLTYCGFMACVCIAFWRQQRRHERDMLDDGYDRRRNSRIGG